MAVVVPIISTFDAKGIDKAIRDFKSLDKAGQRSAFALLNGTKAANSLGKTFAKVTAIGGGLAGAIGGSLVKAAYESQKVMKQTDAIIKATGGAAGLTGEQVAKLSEKLSLQTGVDDELIQTSMNLLLTFKAVRNEVGKGNDIFTRASQAALDLGNVFGSSDAAAVQLGKALSNPLKGVTALRKSGVDFTEAQIKQIKTFVESGKVLEAQKLILAEVEAQVGGTAAATATGFDRMKIAIGNVQENLGDLLLPTVENFANAVINNVLPVLDEFTNIVGKDGIGAGINFLAGSIFNAITNLGLFGKVIVGVTTGLIALNTATAVYKGSMVALNVVTTLTNGAMKALVEGIGAAKIAMATAGVITGILVAAGLAYAAWSGQKAAAAKTTRDLTSALLAEKAAQSGLLVELYNNSKSARAFIDTQNQLGLSTDDLAQYVQKGTGAAAKYTTAWAQADAQANGIQPTLIKFRELLGLSADTSLKQVAGIRNLVIELGKMKGKQEELNVVTALANKLAGVTGDKTTDLTPKLDLLNKVVETAAQKFDKFKTSLFGAANSNKTLKNSIQATKDAQLDLTTSTQKVVDAQEKLNKITTGYGIGSSQASEASSELVKAQREAERAGYALETANFAVTDAQKELQEAMKKGDPTEIRKAQIDLAEAKLSVKEAEDALAEATNKVTTAQTNLNEIINGATTESNSYKDALKELKIAQQEELDAINKLSDAKLRELESTKALAKANLLLQQSRSKLTAKQSAAALKAINEIKVAGIVPKPTNISIGAMSSGLITKSSLDFGDGGQMYSPSSSSNAQNFSSSNATNNITINVNGGDPNAVVAALRSYMRQNGSVPIKVQTP